MSENGARPSKATWEGHATQIKRATSSYKTLSSSFGPTETSDPSYEYLEELGKKDLSKRLSDMSTASQVGRRYTGFIQRYLERIYTRQSRMYPLIYF